MRRVSFDRAQRFNPVSNGDDRVARGYESVSIEFSRASIVLDNEDGRLGGRGAHELTIITQSFRPKARL